jgi:hypothetical protein
MSPLTAFDLEAVFRVLLRLVELVLREERFFVAGFRAAPLVERDRDVAIGMVLLAVGRWRSASELNHG